MLYVRYLVQTGRIRARDWMRISWWFLWYALGLIDFPQAMMRMLMMSSGEEEEPLREETDAWFAEWVAPHITEGAVQRIDQHRAQGHRLVVLSAATVYVVRPLAEQLNIPDYLCTYLEVKEGRFTGQLVEPVCFGQGKALLAEQFAARNDIDLGQSYFYSDGHEDVPMAKKRGWPVESW
jgi:putative phosphoserine phosphatase/1-acylglycerol-3-phosphate O-acyltransferase